MNTKLANLKRHDLDPRLLEFLDTVSEKHDLDAPDADAMRSVRNALQLVDGESLLVGALAVLISQIPLPETDDLENEDEDEDEDEDEAEVQTYELQDNDVVLNQDETTGVRLVHKGGGYYVLLNSDNTIIDEVRGGPAANTRFDEEVTRRSRDPAAGDARDGDVEGAE